MRVRSVLLTTVLALLLLGGCKAPREATMPEAKSKISREQVEWLFNQARQHFDVDGTCVWSFFFTDHDSEKLVAAGQDLARQGYRFVGLLPPDPGGDNQTQFLHVERIEHLTVTSLLTRNEELYAFADEHGLETYDGMDVGPLPNGSCSSS